MTKSLLYDNKMKTSNICNDNNPFEHFEGIELLANFSIHILSLSEFIARENPMHISYVADFHYS